MIGNQGRGRKCLRCGGDSFSHIPPCPGGPDYADILHRELDQIEARRGLIIDKLERLLGELRANARRCTECDGLRLAHHETCSQYVEVE